ncbi:MAG: hypothetical protein DMG39_28650 [Acidobacteria bacterium]|nr:MAG: hypothetical protein DMG39_28650 [Acidobacteriota bacterium]
MRLQGFLIRVGSLALGGMVVAGCLPAAAQNVTTTPETGVTPNTLLLYRADFLPGKEEAYQQTEADIVQGYAGAKIPIYWSALQAVTGPPHVLYFDGFDNFGDIEKAGADLAQGLDAHPEIAALQQKLADLVSASRTTLAFRRDDLGYRLNKIDLAKANYVRVSIFQFRAGYEDEFSEAVRTRARMYETNDIDTPWMFYQVHSGFSLPTYIEFQPMNSLSEIDDALERNAKARRPGGAGSLSAQKWIREADLSIDIQIYRVSQSMSHESAMEAAEAGAKRDSAPTARARKYTLRVKP